MLHTQLRRCWRPWLLGLWVAALALAADPAPAGGRNPFRGSGKVLPFSAQADDVQYLTQKDLMVAHGNVTIAYEQVTVHADELSINRVSLEFEAIGHVRIEAPGMVWQGDRVSGNLRERTFTTGPHQMTYDLWTGRARAAARAANGTITIKGMQMSTCDDWWLKATTMERDDNGDFRLYNARWEVFHVPLLYLPYVSGNTNDTSPVGLEVGKESDWGYYVIVDKDFRLSGSGNRLVPRLAYLSKRGLGLGLSGRFRSEDSRTRFDLFGLNDKEPLHDSEVGDQLYSGRFRAEDERYRFYVEHYWRLNPDFTLRLQGDLESDHDERYDFDRKQYDLNPQYASFLDLEYVEEEQVAGVGVRPRLNAFETVVEEMPAVRLKFLQRELGTSGVYYRGDATAANLSMRWREYDLPRSGLLDPADYSAVRLDTVHSLYRPLALADGVQFVPRASFRLSYYDRSSEQEVGNQQLAELFRIDDRRATLPGSSLAAVNYDEDGGERLRLAGELGFELNAKLWQTWDDASNDLFAINGLRHMAEPYLNYVYIPTPSEDKEHLLFFDEVDRIDRVNLLRLGFRQRLQTRRGGAAYTFFRLENYYDVHLDPKDGQGSVGDLGNVAEFLPADYFTLQGKALLSGETGEIEIFSGGMTLGTPKTPQATVSYLQRNEFTSRYAYSMGSDLTQLFAVNTIPQTYEPQKFVTLNLSTPVGEHTKLEAGYAWDLIERRLAYQHYGVTHEFRCWIVTVGVSEDNNNVRSLYLGVALRQIPSLKLGGNL